MTLAAIKKQYQETILDGMARSLWVMAYADWATDHAVCDHCQAWISRESGTTEWVSEADGASCPEFEGAEAGSPHEPSDTEGPNVAGAGEDWDDAAPETPDAAYLAANALTKLLISSEGMKSEKSALADLFELAMTIDEGGFEFAETEGPSEAQRKERERKFALAEKFGGDLAMMALGTGVSWFDDHKQKSGTGELEIAVPDFSCDYDGQDLSWSGKEGAWIPGTAPTSGHKHGHQQARYVGMGEPTEQSKIGRVTIINPNDANFYKHRYVFAFGAYGDTLLMAYAEGPDSALDECIDWLVEHAPGHIIDEQVNEEFRRLKAEGKSDEKAWEEAEVDTVSGGNAGNHVNASEVHIVAEDPTREQLYEIAQVAENPAGDLTRKGSQLYRKIRDGYTEVGKQKAKEIATRTVMARAKSTRGLVREKPTRARRARQRGRR